MTALLTINNLVIEAQKEGVWTPIVDQVNFTVSHGEVTALIGESGSGKTTIALSALAYTKPGCRHAGGTVRLGDLDLFTLDPEQRRQLRGARVAYVAQSAAAAFNPALTIGNQVAEAAVIHGVMTRREADARAIELYRALELPDPERLGDRYPHQVSGGQLQRLMAAMALISKPDLLVLDEPTTALDVTTQIEVLNAFKRVVAEEGTAAIYVTHDLSVVAQIADRIVVLLDGKVQEQGTVDEIINNPQHPYTCKLMAAVRPVRAGQPGVASTTSLLEVRGVTAGYGKRINGSPVVVVLRDVAMEIRRGETLGVIGESGCGKSTLARVIAGLLPLASGEIFLENEPLKPSIRQRSRDDLRRVQIVFQMADTALNPQQRIDEILGRPLKFYRRGSASERKRRVAELLELVELPASFARRFPTQLSGGQKQRVNLARALAADPDLVLCDEVTSALDTVVGAAIIQLLKRLQAELGVSYVFISHDLSTVAGFADTIMVLYAGKVVECGSTAKVLSPPFHPYTSLLVSSVPELRIGWLEESLSRRELLSNVEGKVQSTEIGCPFFRRCPLAIPGTCNTETPPDRQIGVKHVVSCWREPAELPV